MKPVIFYLHLPGQVFITHEKCPKAQAGKLVVSRKKSFFLFYFHLVIEQIFSNCLCVRYYYRSAGDTRKHNR